MPGRVKFIIFIIAAIIGVFLIWMFGGKSFLIEFKKGKQQENNSQNAPVYPKSQISGISCENYNRRLFAVMLAEDSVARPLSGISRADLVIEMPVVTGSITRIMAVFQCESPEEIGSVRSARHDFIPLAMGLDAIFAHWGGSHFALDELDAKIMDNIDAMPNPFDAFYRKYDIPQPHNGFTSMERLVNAAKKLGYRLESDFAYPHLLEADSRGSSARINADLLIGYPFPFNVEYKYNPETNSYLRWRGGKEEIDKNNNKQVEAKNIAVMRSQSRQVEGDYNDVDVEGEGEAAVYRNSEEIKGIWRKDPAKKSSKLYFYDKSGQEIKFVPGPIWIEIIESEKSVEYTKN